MAATPLNSTHSSTIRRWGTSAWMLVGIAVLASLAYAAITALSGLVVPLVIAVIIGMLAAPLIDFMWNHGIPRPLGTVIFMIALLAAIFGSVVVSVNGVIDQSDEITQQITAGVDRIDQWLEGQDIDIGTASHTVDDARSVGVDWMAGAAGYASTIFTGVLSFLFGSFLALFMLYYVLVDWHGLRDWMGRHLGVPDDLGAGIVDDGTSLVRRGFYALTMSSVVTALLIGATMAILGLPLAFTVALVTFVTSYIPYLGAIFSGVFGFLVALGAGGLREAIILLVVILVVQNVVQTIVGNRLTSSSLKLHPLANLISTIVGAALGGLLGAMLSAPILAMVLAIIKRVREYEPSSPGAASTV